MFAEEANHRCPGKWSPCTPAMAPCSPARHGSGHSLTAGVSVLASSKAPFPGSLLSLAHRISLHYRRHSRSPDDSRATPEVSKMHFRSSSPVCSGKPPVDRAAPCGSPSQMPLPSRASCNQRHARPHTRSLRHRRPRVRTRCLSPPPHLHALDRLPLS